MWIRNPAPLQRYVSREIKINLSPYPGHTVFMLFIRHEEVTLNCQAIQSKVPTVFAFLWATPNRKQHNKITTAF